MARWTAGLAMVAALMGGRPAAGQAYRPDFDPSRLKPAQATPNRVMVLGTPHLSELPGVTAAEVQPLLDRLAAWRPQVITVESLSGPQCEQLRRYAARYTDTADAYCMDTWPAQRATGLDVAAATAEADRLLAAWPAAPTAAQRRRLAAVFLAAGDPTSALVQWLRLPAAERRAGDGLDAGLAKALDEREDWRSENVLIAAPLAVRLGLERVYPVDDHTADFDPGDAKAYGAAMERAWSNPANERRRAADAALTARATTPDGLLALYRALNAPGQGWVVYDSDFGAALGDRSPQGYGRRYVGYWETRNLRMAANIRDALTLNPGSRVLAVVGASHKGYFEAYLHMMHDVRLVDAAAVLR